MQHINNFSRIISGTMTWGSWGKQFSNSEMVGLMHHCIAQGITTFDHADIYGDYSTELDFGNAFVESEVERSSIQLISKCGIQMTTGRKNRLKHYEYTKEYIIWSAEESLRKLRTEYLDLLLLHRPSPLMEPQIIGEAIAQLMQEGKIRQFGVSNFTPSQIAMLEKSVPITGNQVEFSLTHDSPIYDGTFDDCIAQGRMAMAWSPLGAVFRAKNEQTQRITNTLGNLAEKYDVEESQLLLAWVLRHPAKVFPVIGTANKERIALAAKAVDIQLELEDWFALLAASQGHEVP
ncbi:MULTISPECIES: aldo/keto reductase family oxidoreductase [Flavobacteriaceae]|uniref:aldo/keto reductase n=1 Tax=Flavobacteriaceae TaxID=49546 RepID=UPI00149193F5|nr:MULTISPECIES: aldo/keto reductase [Allomuricauda]MDC6365289.1 aldo/keto reductase [Muricauda sp. AC10]